MQNWLKKLLLFSGPIQCTECVDHWTEWQQCLWPGQRQQQNYPAECCWPGSGHAHLLHGECPSYTVSAPLTQWVSFYIVSVLLHSECTLTQWVYLLHSERTLTWWVPVLHSECPLTQWVPLIHWVPLLHGEYPYYTMSAPLTWWVPLLHHEHPSYTVSAPLTQWENSYMVSVPLTQWMHLLHREVKVHSEGISYTLSAPLHWENIHKSLSKEQEFWRERWATSEGNFGPCVYNSQTSTPPPPPAQDVLFNPLCVWITAVWFSAMNPCCWFHSSWQCSHGQT